MKAYTLLATSLLIIMVSGQNSSEPFDNPGEIIPGLTIPYLTNAVGGIWQQERVIDSMAYACTNVAPYLGSIIPAVDQAGRYFGPWCDQVIDAADDLDAFDAEGFCTEIIDMLTGNQAGPLMEYPESMSYPLDIIGILINITRDLYGIDINMIINDTSTIDTICTNVKENFLRPSLQDLISQFGAEVMTYLLPEAVPVCQNWNGFLEGVGINSSSPYYPIIQSVALITSQAVGYDRREDLCQNLQEAVSVQGDNNAAKRSFSRDVISHIFTIPEEADTCSSLANDAISDVIEPLFEVDSSDPFEITSTMIYQYTGFNGGVTGVCGAVETAFTNVIDLPDPVPIQLIPGTTLTVEFFINAVGGIWRQDRYIDSMAFVCTDILPDLESMVPDFKSFVEETFDYGPVCDRILEGARDLDAFDAEGFCNDITAMINNLISGDPGERKRRQADSIGIIDVLAKIVKDLYNIDINDTSTICPNVGQFLRRSIPEILTEFSAELMVEYLPQAAPFCQDWEGTLLDLGINASSPYFQLVQDAVHIGSQVAGYEDRESLCVALNQVLSEPGEDNEARRTFARDIIDSSFEIFTDADTCSTIASDVINDIIEPIFLMINPEFPLTISDYTIYRYTGIMGGVPGVCRVMESAFTQLPGSTVTVKITAESLNGEDLVYTDDLENEESSRFIMLEGIFCGAMDNYLTSVLGSDLRRITCIAVSFSPGSVVAELDIEIFATTQDAADALAEDVADLSTSESLTLSSGGNTLTVSSLEAIELPGSTVTVKITGESLNGEDLVYTDDLENEESSRFMMLKGIFCGAMETYLTLELGSDLRKLSCTAVSFSPGSVVAELDIEIFATTQDAADALAEDVADLSTSESLILSSGGNTLTVSSLETIELPGNAVTLKITGESLNGEDLVYTDDLKNKDSSRFMMLEGIFCGVMDNYLTSVLGSDLRRITCIAVSFSPGSVVAELDVEIFATTQDAADALAEDVADLSSGGNTLTVSSGGNTLTFSSLETIADTKGGSNGGLTSGAIAGIVIGVIVGVLLLVFIIYIVNSKKKDGKDFERGGGVQNNAYSLG